MKVKAFWEFMCNSLGLKFFTGTPIYELKRLFDTMDPSLMHYIPTTNEETALGLVSGVYLSGIKGAIFMSSICFDKLKLFIEGFNTKYEIPVLLIVENDYNPLGLKQFDITSLDQITNYLYEEEYKPCILVIREGDLT